MDPQFDVVVIGGGIVGLATAREILARRPSARLVVLEKERELAHHQSGHNSGVIHSGLYYEPGSLKARLCVRGRERLLRYVAERRIPHAVIGKLIVATRPSGTGALTELFRRARANGVPNVQRLDAAGTRAIEPEVRARAGIHVPGTGIVDYVAVCRAYAGDITGAGGTVRTEAPVSAILSEPEALRIRIGEGGEEVTARYLVNCAGLYSDVIARKAGASVSDRIVPFRGEYYLLRPERRGLVRGLIYPAPDLRLPFVDVHFTPTIHGTVEAGPNAVLGLAREGYRWGDLRLRELGETLVSPGFVRLARHYWPIGVREAYRSLNRDAFLHDLQRMIPALRREDLVRGGAGVRAQAVGADGPLRDDFVFAQSPRALHVVNAPSPAAPSSLAIAEEIVMRLPPTF